MYKRQCKNDDNWYPVKEAQYDMPIKIYKSDKRRAVVGSPEECLLALGAVRNNAVLEAAIGHGGDAFMLMKDDNGNPSHWLHFKIKAEAQRIRDAFDRDRSARTATIILSKPPKSWTLAHRQASNKRRREEIAAGSPVRRLVNPRRTRVQRLGVRVRPTTRIKINKIT